MSVADCVKPGIGTSKTTIAANARVVAKRVCVRASLIFFLLATWSFAGMPEKLATILVLSWFDEADYSDHLKGLSERLLRYGLRDGENYRYEFHRTRNQTDVNKILATRRVGAIVVYSTNTSPASFVVESGTSLPHVFATYSDPLADKWIQSYSSPGGSMTGVVELPLAHEKRLDMLLRVVPNARRIAVILETSSTNELVREAARNFVRRRSEIVISELWVTKGEAISTISQRIRAARIDAAYVPLGGEIAEMSEEVFTALTREKVPAAGDRRVDALHGAVIALEVDRSPNLDSIASQIAMILHGALPSSIPVHSPRRLILMVNLDAARALGIRLPRSVLRQAESIVLDGKF